MTMLLYGAFALVALWLLGEVLVQRMAPLGWRVLAFCGFVVLVLGVHAAQVALIAAGAVAFAVGQMVVTMAVRRGEVSGWGLPLPAGLARRLEGRGKAGADPGHVGEIILDEERPEPAADPEDDDGFEPFSAVPRQRAEAESTGVDDDDTSRFAAVPVDEQGEPVAVGGYPQQDASGYAEAGYQQQDGGWAADGYAEYQQQPAEGYSSGEFAVPADYQQGYDTGGYQQGYDTAGGYQAGEGYPAGYGDDTSWQQPAAAGYQQGYDPTGGYQQGYDTGGYQAATSEYAAGYDTGGWQSGGYATTEPEAGYQEQPAEPATGWEPAPSWDEEQPQQPRHHGRHRS